MTRVIERSDRWTAMIRSTGLAGMVTIVLLFTSLIASSPGEPPFIATAEQAREYFVNLNRGWVQTTMAVTSLSAIGLILIIICIQLVRQPGAVLRAADSLAGQDGERP